MIKKHQGNVIACVVSFIFIQSFPLNSFASQNSETFFSNDIPLEDSSLNDSSLEARSLNQNSLSKNSLSKNSLQNNVINNRNVSTQFANNILVTEDDYLNDVPVVITATRMTQPLNTVPTSITVLDREIIDASGAQEIGDLLRLVPGFQANYFNGTSMSVAYHGFTGNYDRRLQVLIDGRSAYMPFLSTVEWLSLPLDISEIEKIEIVRSSNAPVYGANAMQGVINIITRQPFEDEGFMAEGTWGTHNVSNTDAIIRDLNWNKLKNKVQNKKYTLRYANSMDELDYRVTIGYQKDSGFENVIDSKVLNLINVNSAYQLNTRDSLTMQFGVRAGNMDTFANGVAADPYRNKSVNSQYQSISWLRALPENQSLKVQFYHNYYDQNDEVRIKASESAFGVAYDFGVYYGTAERFDLEVQQILSPYKAVNVMFGVGARLDRIKSKHMLGTDDYINDRSERMFTNIEWTMFEKIIINGGVMLEHNDQIGGYYSPRLAINFLANDEHSFRGSVTRAIRTPSVLENNVDVGVRPDNGVQIYTFHVSGKNLKPERQYSVELGYMFNSRHRNLRFDSKLFVEYLRDGILEAADYDLAGAPWVWGNNTWSNIQGIESQLYYKPHHRFFMNLSHSRASARANWHKYDNQLPDDTRSADREVSITVPEDTFSGLFSFEVTPEIDWSFVYYFVSEMTRLQDGNIIKAHDRLDMRVAWKKKISYYTQMKTSLTLQNIGNDNKEVQKENIFKQRVFLQVGFEW